jgi:hypothetical protein
MARAVFQAFSLAKPRNLRLLSQKLKFWESLVKVVPKPTEFWNKFNWEEQNIFKHETKTPE